MKSYRRPRKIMSVLMILITLFLLISCGGGGGSTTPPPPPPPPPTLMLPPAGNGMVVEGNGIVVGVEDKYAWASLDLKTWTRVQLPLTSAGDDIRSAVYGNGAFIVTTNGDYVLRSTDGVTWSKHTVYPSLSLTFGNGVFVGTAQNGIIVTSSDGKSWTDQTTVSTLLSGVTFCNKIFLAKTSENRIMTSPDEMTWTVNTPSQTIPDLSCANNTFIGFRQNGSLLQIVSSKDGVNWTVNEDTVSSSPEAFRRVANLSYGNGVYVGMAVMCGLKTCWVDIISSTNITNWTLAKDAGLSQHSSIAYGNGVFVAVTNWNYFMYWYASFASVDGINWTTIDPPVPLSNAYFVKDAFLNFGDGSISTSPNGVNWTVVSANYSKSYTVDAKTNASSNSWLDTGFSVVPNGKLTIKATGSACFGPGLCEGPDGSTSVPLNQGCKVGSLIGKIDNGQPFCIGSSYEQTMSTSGKLMLAYNDTDSSNNTGSFDVTVTLTK